MFRYKAKEGGWVVFFEISGRRRKKSPGFLFMFPTAWQSPTWDPSDVFQTEANKQGILEMLLSQ